MANFEVDRITQTAYLSTLEPKYHIYHKENRLKMLQGVVLSQEETYSTSI